MGLMDSIRIRRMPWQGSTVRPRIVTDGTGIRIHRQPGRDGEAETRVSWAEVAEVRAYKRDLLSTDLICLLVFTAAGPVLEVHEEMEGWEELLLALPRHLPGCLAREQVLARMLQPPMATNETVVYARESQPAL